MKYIFPCSMPESMILAAKKGYQILAVGNYDAIKPEDTVIFCGVSVNGPGTMYCLADSINSIGNKCRNYELSALNVLELSNREAISLLGVVVNSAREVSVADHSTSDILKGWGILRVVAIFGEEISSKTPSSARRSGRTPKKK